MLINVKKAYLWDKDIIKMHYNLRTEFYMKTIIVSVIVASPVQNVFKYLYRLYVKY